MSRLPINHDPAYAAQNNFGRMMAVNGTFHGLAIISVGLRMYVRIHMVKSFGIDDAMMISALVFLFGGGIVAQIYSGTHGALGRHQDSIAVTVEDMNVYGMMRYVQGVLMTTTSICLLKFSIGLSLLRLNNTKRWYTRALWALIVFVFCYMVVGWVSLLALCDPIKAAWDKEAAKTARCFPITLINHFAVINTAFNIFTDICFATIPIPMLWTLRMKLRVRIYLIAIFSLGYITVAIGIVKMIYQQTTRDDPDKTFHNWIQFFGLLQQNVGIIAACGPTLKPLFAKSFVSQYSSRRDTSGRVGAYGSRQRPTSLGYTRKEDDADFEMPNYTAGQNNPHPSIVVKMDGSDDGSETFILKDSLQNHVMKKTEITVVNELRDPS